MNKEALIAQLKIIVKPYTDQYQVYENLHEETDFINDLKINSANLVDIVLDIESAFDIIIDTTDMQRMLDVRTTVEIIQTKLSNK